MKIEEITAVIDELDGDLTPEQRDVSIVLLASAAVGPNINKLAKFTGIPRERIRPWARNWRASGVWSNDKVCADWQNGELGAIGFIMDTMVGLGLMKRAA